MSRVAPLWRSLIIAATCAAASPQPGKTRRLAALPGRKLTTSHESASSAAGSRRKSGLAASAARNAAVASAPRSRPSVSVRSTQGKTRNATTPEGACPATTTPRLTQKARSRSTAPQTRRVMRSASLVTRHSSEVRHRHPRGPHPYRHTHHGQNPGGKALSTRPARQRPAAERRRQERRMALTLTVAALGIPSAGKPRRYRRKSSFINSSLLSCFYKVVINLLMPSPPI